jgi:hypothetical protein
MGWQDDPIATPAPQQAPAQPWESDPIIHAAEGPRVAHGIADAAEAGYQGSLAGLADRGRLPDVVLDPQHATWYEKLVAGGSQLFHEFPEMVEGGMAGGAVGALAGPLGATIGAGAGAFAVPTAIRESLIQAYSKGQVTGSGDFLSRASIVLQHTGKDALVGALTGGVGRAAELAVAPFLGQSVMAGSIGPTAARAVSDATKLAYEGATLTVAPAALEGRLPEPEDFLNTAIMLAGLKGAHIAAGRLQDVYAATGKTPMEVAADARVDPTIVEDLTKPAPPVAEPTPMEKAQDVSAQFRGTQSFDTWLAGAHYGNGLAEVADALGVPHAPGTHKGEVIAQIKQLVGEKPKAPVAPEYVDTRGAGERFHGTSAEIPSLSDEYALSGDNRNIYGQGFYTTDAVDVSAGYMKKGGGGNATLYKVENKDVPLYDMEAPVAPEVQSVVQRAMGDHFPTENAETGKPLSNLREIYDEFRAESKNNGLTRDDVQEVFDSIRSELEKQGYRGFRHVGGLKTGRAAHDVNIFWSPAQDVSIKKADLAAYRAQRAPADPLAEYGPEIPAPTRTWRAR